MTKQEQAKKDYLAGMKYKDIASKYEVSINTVKSWKNRYGWQRGAPAKRSMRTKVKKGAHKVTKVAVEKITENDELTEKQKRFCLFYLQRFNATWAYQQAYECSYEVANAKGPSLLVKDSIKIMLKELKKQQSQELYVDANDILQGYLKQATADVTDVVEFETVKRLKWQKNYSKDGKYGPKSNPYDYVPVIDPDTGEQAFYFEQVVKLRDSKNVDTSNIKSIRIDKGEAVVEMYDKQKAMKELLERLPATDDLNKHKTRKLKAEADIAEAKARILNDKGDDTETKVSKLLDKIDEAIEGNDNNDN
ncbi:terminase small subunit [Liquorilactobacillus satsumensis]|uniref:terminase small subunit n=1 Tax=Liquorilactobacillus satsumensis TaxID=259059 RepID=UPI001E29E5FF|nr:terminase small subunit [Liquorilactobacillus satsumensis]MCC7667444.1 terminase [Liquorilactobacillus satsumensis]